MEKIISKIAGLGIPGLILMVAIEATGLAGAAAITAALAALGPGGMLGGVALLCAAGLVADALAEYGFSAIFEAVIRELYVRGETKDTIRAKIARYPVSKALKAKLMEEVNRFSAVM